MYQDGEYLYPQSDHLLIADLMIPPFGRVQSHGKIQYIPGMQVLVLMVSWLWNIYLFILEPGVDWFVVIGLIGEFLHKS